MSDSLESTLGRVQAALQQAAVGGTVHTLHALELAASYSSTLDEVGLHALAEQLISLPDTDVLDRPGALAEALRSTDLALTYLLRPEVSPPVEAAPWLDGTVLLETPPDLESALYTGSELQWAWALERFRVMLPDRATWLLERTKARNVRVRRRAVQALGYGYVTDAINELIQILDQQPVSLAAIRALLRISEVAEDEVVEALLDALEARKPQSVPEHLALMLYRLEAYESLYRYHQHKHRMVRCYAQMAAAGDNDPLASWVPDDSVAQLVVKSAVQDRTGGASGELLTSLMGVQKKSLRKLCLLLSDTPTGLNLLNHARALLTMHSTRERRQRACMVVEVLGDARDVPSLMKPGMRAYGEAYHALAVQGGEQVFQYLHDAVEGKVTGAQIGPAIHALGVLGDERAVPTLTAILTGNPVHNRSAAGALAALGAREALPHLLSRLKHAQPFELNTYVEALIRINDPAAVDGFVATLLERQKHMTAMRRVLVRGLVHFGDDAVDAVVGLLSHDDSRVRALAEEVLTNIRTLRSQEVLEAYLDKDPLQHLLARLTYGSSDVKQEAERELDEMSGQQLASILEEALRQKTTRDSIEQVKALLKALAKLQLPEVVGPLHDLVSTKHIGLAKSAMAALSSFPYVVNRPTLMTRLQTQQIAEARRAARVLGQQDMTVVAEVLPQLSSNNPNARAGALTVLGAKRARWTIYQVMPLFDDPNPRVRMALASNITQLSVPSLEDEIVSQLITALEGDSKQHVSPLVVALQVMACGTGRDDVHDILVAMWRRQTRQAGQILEAIGAVGNRDAIDILMSELGSPNTRIVQGVVAGMTRLGDPAAMSVLEGAFDRVSSTTLFRSLHSGLTHLANGWHRLYRAQSAMVRGNPAVALSEVESYVVDNPEDGSGYLERGRARHLIGDISGAYDDYLRANKYLGRNKIALWSAALAAHQLGELEVALEHYSGADLVGGSDSEVRLRRGLLRLELQDYQGALEEFRHVAGNRSKGTSFHKRVGETLVEVVSLFVAAPPNKRPSRVQLLALMDRPLPNRLADLVVVWALILVQRFTGAGQCLDRFAQRWPDALPYTLLSRAWLYTAAGDLEISRGALDDLKGYSLHRGYNWGDFVLYGFSDWPVVCEPLTGMLLNEVRSETGDA